MRTTGTPHVVEYTDGTGAESEEASWKTIPDFFCALDDKGTPKDGLSVYLDELAATIHGNPTQATKDRNIEFRRLRGHLRQVYDLDKKDIMVSKNAKIARFCVCPAKGKELKVDATCFNRASKRAAPLAVPLQSRKPTLRLIKPTSDSSVPAPF